MRLSGLVLGFLAFSSLFAATGTHAASCGDTPTEEWVKGDGNCLALYTYGSPGDAGSTNLIVFLHGDVSRGGGADYHTGYAKELADRGGAGTISVAMVRPGYPSGDGRWSEGDLHGRRDHYTEANNATVADGVARLKEHYGATRVVLVGHSGGAAMSGVVMGRYPGVADAAFLISCPCNVERWRSNRRPWPRSLSPHDYVDGVSKDAMIVAITGAFDKNTRWSLAERYIASLVQNGGAGEAIKVDGAGHNLRKSFWQSGRMTERILGLLNP